MSAITTSLGLLPRMSSAGIRAALLAAPWLAAAPVLAEMPPTSTVQVVAPADETALVVDTAHQAHTVKPGERTRAFRFTVTNASDHEMVINQVRTSCGCAVAQLPSQPWHLAAGASGIVLVTLDLRGMSGVVVRTATIDLPASFKLLTMTITVPPAAKKSS